MGDNIYLLLVTITGILLLLFLVIKLKIHAFISLLIISMLVGLAAGMDVKLVIDSIKNGMGGTLGYVATLVGLGAIFGKMLEVSGGADALAATMLKKTGNERASWALMITGFIIAIPIFFDVGFIIMVPLIYSLTRNTKKPILIFAIPFLAGLAVTHTFIPPTPGPIAVSDIIGVPLGWVILFGFIVGIPTAVLAGPVFGKYISTKVQAGIPDYIKEYEETGVTERKISFRTVVLLIAAPLILILLETTTSVLLKKQLINDNLITKTISFSGHPFVALTLATLLSIIVLRIKIKIPGEETMKLATKSLAPAGIVILVTGAGGVFKQVLMDSGIGNALAQAFSIVNFSPIILGFILAAIVRITQGSATVAMITAAGLLSPVIAPMSLSDPMKALIVISIASGATILSHVNDSGFWLVGKYLGLNEKDTLRSWTIMETIIALSGLFISLILSLLI